MLWDVILLIGGGAVVGAAIGLIAWWLATHEIHLNLP